MRGVLYMVYFVRCAFYCFCFCFCLGEFGTVYRAVWKDQAKKQVEVAVKTLKVSCCVCTYLYNYSCYFTIAYALHFWLFVGAEG